MFELYLTQFKTSLAVTVQYRMATFLWLIGLVIEPVIYLVVWSTIARAQGGSVGGYTAGEFAAYYIAWTLVRQMNIALTPYAFEERVQRGGLSAELLRPIHPFHFDLGWFFGMKVVEFVAWIPIAVVLTLIFQPTLNPQWWQVVGFLIAIVTAFVMRFILLWVLGMATFWITRVSAMFELYFAAELLLSGRLVPLSLMPEWVQNLSYWLPYRWAFAFQIELLIGRLTPQETLYGFAMQGFWMLVGAILLNLVWRAGVKKYSAVGA